MLRCLPLLNCECDTGSDNSGAITDLQQQVAVLLQSIVVPPPPDIYRVERDIGVITIHWKEASNAIPGIKTVLHQVPSIVPHTTHHTPHTAHCTPHTTHHTTTHHTTPHLLYT